MPEGDSIFRAARSLHRVLAGHVVTKFETAYAHLDRVDVDTPVVGRTIEECVSAGKHLLIVFSGDLILRTHMRMNGSWHLYRPWRAMVARTAGDAGRLDTADWVAVAFNVPVAEFVTTKQLETRDPVAQLGPICSAGVRSRRSHPPHRGQRPPAPIAMTLLDQRIVAGIGNVYKSEVLFLSGVHPDEPSSAVPLPTLERMMDIARGLLQDNVVDGSSPRIQTYRNLRQLNPASEHDDSLWVYGRRAKPCRKCGTPIELKKMGLDARTTYWCPTCQAIR